ncbi:hypothetical protein BDV96DRAFT_590711 [Lophiotrema nucula]|uniref:Uncharacterized protein n=1 Tax=Lophiotrema nucula TaxID=690887 RepID=A0A6A5YHG9_9PLEO|nr:hypothetical protein BDV96DRAFT_590711 [Lophiotrema nucula]
MYSCCRGQPIVAYGASERNPQPCYMYCLAQEQTVGDLIDCLNDPFQEVLCNGDKSSTGNETTFGTPSPPASGSGSVSASLSASGSTGAAAPGTAVHPGASKWGVGILVMLGIGSAVGMLL